MAEFINCNFLNNIADNYGGIYSYNSALRIANILLKNASNNYYLANNLINSKGIVGLEGSSQLIAENLQFYNNTASNRGSCLYLS
jgi:hypothetical protein